ncbi:hypothetical protein PybrP1_001235 [[Pythium] brassicae (nom. inval.)]|nr:hypothetical protein PybrP1_001235 [[Pythium] brassicae (nom. inval.)]
MHGARSDDPLKKSWSFISEDSFSAAVADVPLDALEWEQYPDSDDVDELVGPDLAVELQLQRMRAPPHRRHSTDPKRKRTVTFQDGIPVVSRKSSLPEPIQLLQEPPSRRARAATGAPDGVFNHTLYGSLRAGPAVALFSREYCGLAVSGAAAGFLVPFLERCVHPLLCDYLGLDAAQADATFRFLLLPGVASFFLGVLSDFFPLWSLHRKAYIVLGWVLAYAALMALVAIALFDFGRAPQPPAFSFTRFHGGAAYVLLLMGAGLGVTLAAVASFAFLVELSQREPIHERGALVLAYVITRECATLVATIATSQAMTRGPSGAAAVSMKVLLLALALVALVPIPAVLYRLEEDRRQLKVDAVDRLSLAAQLWRILQQEAVWRIVLFICLTFFLGEFRFEFAAATVRTWAGVDADLARVALIPHQTMVILALVTFRYALLNYSWVRVAAAALVVSVAVDAAASLPVVYARARHAGFFVPVQSLSGLLAGATVIVTTLPLVEITETGIEGATTGLVASYHVLIRVVLLSVSDWLGASGFVAADFAPAAVAADARRTRNETAEFLLLSYGVNLLALAPIAYLLPRQKLDAQQMRTYGGFSWTAGVAIALLFVVLLGFAAAVNILALMHKLG